MKGIMKQPELGGYIAHLRKEQGLTQEELVELCNINVRTIQRIEAGDVTPRNYTIKNILRALGSSFEDLINERPQYKTTDQVTKSTPLYSKHALIIGVIGIIYILISIPFAYVEVSAAVGGMRLWSPFFYGTMATMYSFFLTFFYVGFVWSLKIKSWLLKVCTIIFLVLEILSTAASLIWYKSDMIIFWPTPMKGVEFIVFQCIYAVSLIILSIPFVLIRKQFDGVYKYLGLTLAISGISHLTIILFPVGILGSLLFDIMLVTLILKTYQESKVISTVQ